MLSWFLREFMESKAHWLWDNVEKNRPWSLKLLCLSNGAFDPILYIEVKKQNHFLWCAKCFSVKLNALLSFQNQFVVYFFTVVVHYFEATDNFSLFENRKQPLRIEFYVGIVTMLGRFWVSTFFLKVIYLLCGAQFFAVRQKSILDCDLSIFHKEMLNRFWGFGLLLSNLILR